VLVASRVPLGDLDLGRGFLRGNDPGSLAVGELKVAGHSLASGNLDPFAEEVLRAQLSTCLLTTGRTHTRSQNLFGHMLLHDRLRCLIDGKRSVHFLHITTTRSNMVMLMDGLVWAPSSPMVTGLRHRRCEGCATSCTGFRSWRSLGYELSPLRSSSEWMLEPSSGRAMKACARPASHPCAESRCRIPRFTSYWLIDGTRTSLNSMEPFLPLIIIPMTPQQVQPE